MGSSAFKFNFLIHAIFCSDPRIGPDPSGDDPQLSGSHGFGFVRAVCGNFKETETGIAVVVGVQRGRFAISEPDAVFIRDFEAVLVIVAEVGALEIAVLDPALVKRAALPGVSPVGIDFPAWRTERFLELSGKRGKFDKRIADPICIPEGQYEGAYINVLC